MPDALRTFADDLDDPSAVLIIAALIINARLRGPGLRDLLGALSMAVREELDMRRKVNAERRSTRRSAQIVVLVSVGLALGLALLNPSYVHVYDSPLGQLVLVVVVALYAAGLDAPRPRSTPERLTGPPRSPIPRPRVRGRGPRDRRPAHGAGHERGPDHGAWWASACSCSSSPWCRAGPAWPGSAPRSTRRARR
jgi:hypothetical protein